MPTENQIYLLEEQCWPKLNATLMKASLTEVASAHRSGLCMLSIKQSIPLELNKCLIKALGNTLSLVLVL